MKMLDFTQKSNRGLFITDILDHDALTGLWSRGVICHLLEKELTFCGQKNGLALLMLDMDHFKLVNDQHVDQAGDSILIEVA
jgi:diguanylate cyclase (GGDEF)-like protein